MEKRPRIFYGWIILGVAFITIILGYTIRNTFSVFYPAVVDEFGWERGSTALMFSITILFYGLVAPAAGGMVDRFGPRLVLPVGGLALWEVALSYAVWLRLSGTSISTTG